MCARILALPLERMRAAQRAGSRSSALADPETIHFWRGASGRAYVHSVYPLLECPPLPPSNYVLAKRDGTGRAVVVHVGRLRHAAPTLNLAEVRQRAASLGAREVHVHLLAGDAAGALGVELDLKCALGA